MTASPVLLVRIPIWSKASRLWESLFARKSQHEVLASGPIEDLIAHREHRYRISGSSLRAAMGPCSHVPYSDVLSGRASEKSPSVDNCKQINLPETKKTMRHSLGWMIEVEEFTPVLM